VAARKPTPATSPVTLARIARARSAMARAYATAPRNSAAAAAVTVVMMVRWIAVLVLGAVAAVGCGGSDSDARPTAGAVPILLYHHLGAPPPGDRHASLYVDRRQFTAQVRALHAAGFHAVTLGQVRRAWRGGPPLPARPVVLTFDDGFAEQDRVARPLLAGRRWPGVLNLQLNRLGVPGGLSRAAVRRMVAAGWEVGDHSTTHPDLTRVGAARLRAEVAGSRAAFARELGLTPAFFCYPYGRADGRVRRAVKAAGFLGATTTKPVRATPRDDPFALPRIVVRRGWTPAQLVRVASGR
jgi:peptidoglycan/xylan/chitin deacetylase (PgdA/CDA1 family)